MKPRDLTPKNWDRYQSDYCLRSGVSVNIGWRTGDISFRFDSNGGCLYFVLPRKTFDKMSDWYIRTCDAKFWKGRDSVDAFFGKRIKQFGIKHPIQEWQINASQTVWDDGKEKIEHTVMIRGEGLWSQVAVMFLNREDFDKIIRWYNSDYKLDKKAA